MQSDVANFLPTCSVAWTRPREVEIRLGGFPKREPSYEDIIGFFQIALPFHILETQSAISWADGEIAKADTPDLRLIAISSLRKTSSDARLGDLGPAEGKYSSRSVGMFLSLLHRTWSAEKMSTAMLITILNALTLNENLVLSSSEKARIADIECAADSDRYDEGGLTDAEAMVREFLSFYEKFEADVEIALRGELT